MAPQGGTVQVTPDKGKGMETDFTISTSGWTDDSNDELK
jgi:hypothetical protein